MNPADVLKVSIEVASFLARVIPSLVELWNAHGQKDDVVISILDAALAVKRAANDQALELKHRQQPPGV